MKVLLNIFSNTLFLYLALISLVSQADELPEQLKDNLKKGTQEYVIRFWNNTNGLPHNTIYAMEKGPLGFMWMATEEGLTRFDGSNIEIFNKDNIPELIENSFYGFFPIEGKGIWAAGDYSLAFIYKNIIKVVDCHDIITDTWITAVTEDHEGNLWIGTKNGNLFRVIEDKPVQVPNWLPKENLSIQSLYSLKNQMLIGSDMGLFTMDLDSFEYSRIGPNDLNARIIFEVKDQIYIGAPRTGILTLEKSNDLTTYIDDKDLAFLDYRNLRADHEGIIWGGTEKGELLIIEEGEVSKVPLPEIRDISIRKLWIDEDMIFIGTQGKGLAVVRKSNIQKFDHALLSNQNIRPIFKSPNGTTWIGTKSDGLFRIDGNKTLSFTTKTGLLSDAIVSIGGDDEKIYVGTRNGMHQINASTNKIERSYHPNSGFQGDHVNTILKDSGGKIWFSIANQGIYYLDEKGDAVKINLPEKLQEVSYITVKETKSGDLLYGSITKGMVRITDGKFKEHIELPLQPGENIIYSIFEDNDGSLWLGTQGGILWYQNKSFKILTKTNGLNANGIYSIIEDHNGYIWLSSNFGLQRIAKEELTKFKLSDDPSFFVTSNYYGHENGMSNEETNSLIYPSAVMDNTGSIWYPTIEGISIVDPKLIYEERSQLNFQWDILRLGNSFNNILPGQTIVEIPAGVDYFSIKFSNINYHDPEQVAFYYRVKSLSENWIYLNDRKELFFNGMEPGNYTLEIKTIELGNIESVHRLNIKVLPLFYQTYTFRLALTVLAILLAMFLVQYYLKVKIGKDLERMVEQRTHDLNVTNNKLESALLEIESQNEALRNITWQQSHTVRGPLSKAMAIVQMLMNYSKYHDLQMSRERLFLELEKTLEELDMMIREINNKFEGLKK